MTTHDRQFCAPPTGKIYTAPHASDHIAVSVLLDDAAIAQPLSLSLDEPTKACSFRPQKTLASFFAPKASAPAASDGSGSSKRPKV
eukprot:3920856-Prymnesium_polylepis.1